MPLPKGAAKEGVYYELDYPPYVASVTEAKAGKLQLIVSGEEHDQGIPADEFVDYYANLETWAKGKWPGAGPRSHQWSFQARHFANDSPCSSQGRRHRCQVAGLLSSLWMMCYMVSYCCSSSSPRSTCRSMARTHRPCPTETSTSHTATMAKPSPAQPSAA